MKKNKLLVLLLAIGMTTSVLAGCSSSNTNLSEAQKIEILNEIKLYEVSGDKTFEKLEELVDKNIENYDEKEKDIMINQYISQLYSNLGELNNTLSVIGYELEKVVEKYDIDINNPKTYKKIPDSNATIKGFLTELNNKGFSLEQKNKNSAYTIGVDSIALSEKYSKHASKSLAKFLEFNAYEVSKGEFANMEQRTVDLDEVAKRIIMIEEGMALDKEQEYMYLSSWMSALNYYYPILTGTAHDYFVSTEYLKDDILAKYESLSEKYKEKQLGNVLNQIVSLYKENGKKADEIVLKTISDIVDKEVMTEDIKNIIKESMSIDEITLEEITEKAE